MRTRQLGGRRHRGASARRQGKCRECSLPPALVSTSPRTSIKVLVPPTASALRRETLEISAVATTQARQVLALMPQASMRRGETRQSTLLHLDEMRAPAVLVLAMRHQGLELMLPTATTRRRLHQSGGLGLRHGRTLAVPTRLVLAHTRARTSSEGALATPCVLDTTLTRRVLITLRQALEATEVTTRSSDETSLISAVIAWQPVSVPDPRTVPCEMQSNVQCTPCANARRFPI